MFGGDFRGNFDGVSGDDGDFRGDDGVEMCL